VVLHDGHAPASTNVEYSGEYGHQSTRVADAELVCIDGCRELYASNFNLGDLPLTNHILKSHHDITTGRAAQLQHNVLLARECGKCDRNQLLVECQVFHHHERTATDPRDSDIGLSGEWRDERPHIPHPALECIVVRVGLSGSGLLEYGLFIHSR
jgi:hypothetical protein